MNWKFFWAGGLLNALEVSINIFIIKLTNQFNVFLATITLLITECMVGNRS